MAHHKDILTGTTATVPIGDPRRARGRRAGAITELTAQDNASKCSEAAIRAAAELEQVFPGVSGAVLLDVTAGLINDTDATYLARYSALTASGGLSSDVQVRGRLEPFRWWASRNDPGEIGSPGNPNLNEEANWVALDNRFHWWTRYIVVYTVGIRQRQTANPFENGAVLNAIGHTNQTNFRIIGVNWPPNCVLMLPPDNDYSPGGTSNIIWRFRIRYDGPYSVSGSGVRGWVDSKAEFTADGVAVAKFEYMHERADFNALPAFPTR